MNDIYKIPVKCRDCPYWEIATYPWCCGDCKDIMNPKNGEYIKRIDAKRALTALSADLDAETVQRCIEAMNNLKAADVEPKRKWVSVTERLPEPKRNHYLCYLDDDSIAVCYWSNVSIRGNKWEWHNPNWKEVTHWMPLPEPPKEGDNETLR